MRRCLSWLALLLLVSTALSGCAREAKPEDPAPAPGEIQSIRVLTYPNHPIDHYLDLLIPGFQELYPQYRVEKVHFTEDEEIRARVEAGEADVVPISDWFRDTESMVQDLGPYIQRDRLDLSKYGPGFADLRTDGGIFYLTSAIMPYVILAHTDHLEAAGVTLPQAGWTWEEFRAVAKQLTRAEPRVYGLNDSPVDYLGRFWLEGKLGARHWNLAEPDLRGVLSYVQTLAHTDRSLQPPKPATGEIYVNYGDFEGFLAGKATMALGPYAPDLHDQFGLKVAMAPVPHHPGSRRISMAVPWNYGMAATTDRPDAAWALIHYAVGPKGAVALDKAGILPMYQDEAVRAAWQPAAPQWAETTATFFDTTWEFEMILNASTEGHRQTYAYRQLLERALHESIHRVATGELDIEGAVALYAQRKEEHRRRFPMAER